MTKEEHISNLETIGCDGWTVTTEAYKSLQFATKSLENIKLLGEELRKVREGITDQKVLIGFNMAIAICNKYLGESEDKK